MRLAAILFVSLVCVWFPGLSQYGVVLESLDKGREGDLAGFLPGDILLKWKRIGGMVTKDIPDEKKIFSAASFYVDTLDLDSRGPVRISGLRGNQPFSLVVKKAPWGFRYRSRFPEKFRDAFNVGSKHLEGERADQAAVIWQGLAHKIEKEGMQVLSSWLYGRIGRLYTDRNEWDKGWSFYQKSQQLAVQSRDLPAQGMILIIMGHASRVQGDFHRSKQYFKEAIEVWRAYNKDGIQAAEAMNHLGNTYWYSNDFDNAESCYRRSLEIYESLTSDSIYATEALHNIGIAVQYRGDLEKAELIFRRILEKYKKHGSEYGLATAMNDLGNVLRSRGKYTEAREYYVNASEIIGRLEPDSLYYGVINYNICNVLLDQDLAVEARLCYTKSENILEKVDASRSYLASTLMALGVICKKQGDYLSAKDYFFKTMLIHQGVSDYTQNQIEIFNALGAIEKDQGNFDKAEIYHLQSLDISQDIAKGSILHARILLNLGILELDRPDSLLHLAKKYLLEANEIHENHSVKNLDTSLILTFLGETERRFGKYDSAKLLLGRGLEIAEALAPQSKEEAYILLGLAKVYKDCNQYRQAEVALLKSMNSLETHYARFGTRGVFESQFGYSKGDKKIYTEALELFVNTDQLSKALEVLERSNSQLHLKLKIDQDNRLTYNQRDEEAEMNRFKYDKAFKDLRNLEFKKDDYKIRRLHSQLKSVLESKSTTVTKQKEVNFEIDIQSVVRDLEPNTVVLAYSIRETKTDIFVLSRDSPLTVKSTPVESRVLEQKIKRLTNGINQAAGGKYAYAMVMKDSETLYQKLISPVAQELRGAIRIIIIPEGPLHLLPFGLLSKATQGENEFLIEKFSITKVSSLNQYIKLSAEFNKGNPYQNIIAFGNPNYSPGDKSAIDLHKKFMDFIVDNPILKMISGERRSALEPLPHTQFELNALKRIFPEANLFTKNQATEEAAKSCPYDVDILHFACHGILDDYLPLNSALALSIPFNSETNENGFLQVWEIMKDLRINAKLVVLSACDTGKGKQVNGEGLIGLTQAFQYAGARSVLNTLWKITDKTTAVFINQFYRHLRMGLAKDEALRAAQLDFIKKKVVVLDEDGRNIDISHPKYWAAFQLDGNWK